MKRPTPNPSPRSAKTPVPLWLTLGSVAVLASLAVFIHRNAGDFDARVHTPWRSTAQLALAQPREDGSLHEMGRTIYVRLCSQCHQFDGMGDPLKAPPLVGAEWLMGAGPNRIGRIMLDGFTGPVTVRGQIYNLTMPAWRDSLTDEQIAAVLSYTRNEWTNRADEIKPAQIQAIREATRGRPVPWTAEEINRIPER
jgi:mono/diheme cytochrome c family protein